MNLGVSFALSDSQSKEKKRGMGSVSLNTPTTTTTTTTPAVYVVPLRKSVGYGASDRDYKFDHNWALGTCTVII